MLHGYTNLQIRGREFVTGVSQRDRGASMVEYALLVALIAIALVSALVFLRGGIGNFFSRTSNTLNNL